MASRFTLKTGDTGPPLVAVITDVLGNVVNLTGATVEFWMTVEPLGSNPTIKIAAEILSPTKGEVRVKFSAVNTAIAGTYQYEFKIHASNGELDSAPNEGYALLNIVPSV